jgi:hypothetical protein
LPRETETIAPEQEACPSCGGTLRQLGEDVSETLEYVPAKFIVIRTVRPTLSCGSCSQMGADTDASYGALVWTTLRLYPDGSATREELEGAAPRLLVVLSAEELRPRGLVEFWEFPGPTSKMLDGTGEFSYRIAHGRSQ